MEHKIIIIFDLLLFIFKSIEGATHWVVTEDGKISVQVNFMGFHGI